jgi:chromosomal replication initiation ATPase DnaA
MHDDQQPQDANKQFGSIAEANALVIEHHLLLLSIEQVIEARLGHVAELVTAPTRGRPHVVFARHLAMYLAHTAGSLSLTAAGALFERTRGAAVNAVNRLDERRETDPDLDRALPLLQADVRRRLTHQLTRWHAKV